MASRDLTRRFEALRNSSRAKIHRTDLPATKDPENNTLITLTDDGSSTSPSPPSWVEIVQNVKSDIKTVKENLKILERLQSERLKVSFESANQTKVDNDIEILSEQITKLLRSCEQSVKAIAIADIPKGSSGLQLTSQERASRINVMRGLGLDLQEQSKRFRTMQKQFLNTLNDQGSIPEAFGINSDAQNEEDGEMQRQHMNELIQNSDVRYKAILKIAQSVNELMTLFKELNVLVVEQGSVLDRIDYNIEQAVIKVQSGTTHLKKADETSKKAYSFKCMILLVVVLAILIIVLIIKKSSS